MRHPLTQYCKKGYPVYISPDESDVFDCNAKVRAREHAQRVFVVAENPANAFNLGPIQLCGVCATPIDDDYYRGREKLWDNLPTLFGLPPWDELKDFYP